MIVNERSGVHIAIVEIVHGGVILLPRDYCGLSTDAKPTTDSAGKVLAVGSSFLATDTGDKYFFDGTVWWLIAQTVRATENLTIPQHIVINQVVPANGYWTPSTFFNFTGYSHLGVGATSNSTTSSWVLGSVLSPDGVNACGTAVGGYQQGTFNAITNDLTLSLPYFMPVISNSDTAPHTYNIWVLPRSLA